MKNNPNLDLHSKDDNFGHFFVAFLFKRLEIVRLFMNHPGVDLNKKDKYGNTVLWMACNWGDVEVLKLLLRNKRTKYLQNHREISSLLPVH